MLLANVLADSSALLGAASGGVEVDFAPGPIVVQIVLFVGLWLVLKPTLFDPMLALFEEREKRIEGAKVQARHTDEASAGALQKYESAMAKARSAAGTERDLLRTEGLKAEAGIVGRVRAETAKTLEKGRAELAGEMTSARVKLKQEAAALGRELASRVLGREVS